MNIKTSAKVSRKIRKRYPDISEYIFDTNEDTKIEQRRDYLFGDGVHKKTFENMGMFFHDHDHDRDICVNIFWIKLHLYIIHNYDTIEEKIRMKRL